MADSKSTTMAVRNVKADEVYADYSRNFRMAESYGECLPISGFNPEKQKPNLYEDIKANGISTPLALAELSSDEAERISAIVGRKIRYRIVRGHRRFRCVENVRKDNPHMFIEIPAMVYKNLSGADEFRLMADHAHVKGLNEYELFDAIKKLALNTNLSEEAIGHQVGRSRGYVQRRKWIMNLPPCVEENFRAKFLKDDQGKPVPHTAFTDGDLQKLYAAQGRDKEAGREPLSEGSEFANLWNNLENTGRAAPPEPKAWTRKDMLGKLEWIKEPIVRNVLQACAGEPVKLTDSVEQIDALRATIKELREEIQNLRAGVTDDPATGTDG